MEFIANRKSNKNLIIYFDGSEITIKNLQKKYSFIFPVVDAKTKQYEKGKAVIINGINVISIIAGDFICLSDYSIQILNREQVINEFELTQEQLELIGNK